MNFDQTFIAIRERKILEIFDLALHVIRDHFRPLIVLLVIGVLPWAVLDHLLIGWMLGKPEYSEFPLLYGWMSTILVISQAQIATSFISLYLGEAMFVGRPGIWDTILTTFKRGFFLVWLQSTTRLVVPILLCCLLVSADGYGEEIYFPLIPMLFLLFIATMVRWLRPYVTEILLLEQTPVTGRGSNSVTFSRRNKALHGQAASELFGRAVVGVFLYLPLTFGIFAGLITLDSLVNVSGSASHVTGVIYWNVALWLMAGFSSVVRFLSYIDLRIRQEGWAVELRVRAESARVSSEAVVNA